MTHPDTSMSKHINYKSDDGLSELESAAYFYNEKGDIERYVGIDRVYARLPELKRAWEYMKAEIDAAERRFIREIQEMIDNHNPSEWGN